MNTTRALKGLLAAGLIASCAANAMAQGTQRIDPAKARVIEHWTAERRANAIPRDLVIDPRGLGYLRGRGGVLEPYGHSVAAQTAEKAREPTPSPFGKPGGGTDSTGATSAPVISDMNPDSGRVIGSSYTFSAVVTDPEGIRSVTFRIWKGASTSKQSFSASKAAGTDVWSVPLRGFTDGDDWRWDVVAKDASGKGGVTSTSTAVTFTVKTGDSSSTGTGTGTAVVANDPWTDKTSPIYKAAGRLYFEMPRNAKRSSWTGYVCSGTVVNDGVTGTGTDAVPRPGSRILTAAHCIYDDANKAFARNVMFIPQQADAGPTDLNCNNDPIGCWAPSYGVVDLQWTNKTFPNNVKWDYGFYVVSDSNAHTISSTKPVVSDALDSAAGALAITFGAVAHDVAANNSDRTHALGYSYSEDPKFMYCAEDMAASATVNWENWWLGSCGLSGGSSGGPWIQPMSETTATDGTTIKSGPIISVNSWGYTTLPGMAGPRLDSSATAQAVFACAVADRGLPGETVSGGNEGVIVNAGSCTKQW